MFYYFLQMHDCHFREESGSLFIVQSFPAQQFATRFAGSLNELRQCKDTNYICIYTTFNIKH